MDLKAKCGTNKNVQVHYELLFFDKYSRANNALKLLCVDKPVQIICDGCANNGPPDYQYRRRTRRELARLEGLYNERAPYKGYTKRQPIL